MNIQSIQQAIYLLAQIFGMFVFFGTALWAVNKLWLSSIYVNKTDLEKVEIKIQNDIKQAGINNFKTQTDVQKIERELAIFKERYNGDSALLKEQMATQNERSKEILHKVNNIANLNLKELIEEAFEKHEK